MSLRINSDFNGVTDPDAGAYIAAVEAADGNQLLEFAVGKAINDFVVGCKADGIWDAIKASCILAGARTLSGALVPLAGTPPTSVGFVSANYNRKIGLKATGSQYIYTPAVFLSGSLSRHSYAYLTQAVSGVDYNAVIGGNFSGQGEVLKNASSSSFLLRPWGGDSARGLTGGVGGLGIARQNSSQGVQYTSTGGANVIAASATSLTQTVVTFFARDAAGFQSTDPRIAFISAGMYLNLPSLDARVTALINAFGAAIP